MSWIEVGKFDDIPQLGSRVIHSADGNIAIFRTSDDMIFALRDACPHKGGPLSQGIVFDHRVACPLHNRVTEMDTGKAAAPDEGCTQRYATRIENGTVFISLTAEVSEVEELSQSA